MRGSFRLLEVMLAGVVLTWPAVARAQRVTAFGDLPLRLDLGDTVTVDDTSGRRVRGRLLELTREFIVVDQKTGPVSVSDAAVRRVGRCCDSLRNGMLIGATPLAALGFVGGLSFGERSSVGAGLLLAGVLGGLGAGIGAGVDALIARDVEVYRAGTGRVSVTLAGSTRGLRLVIRLPAIARR